MHSSTIPTIQRKQGFTLVELTIACVITFMLFAVLLPVFIPRRHERTQQQIDISNQKQIGLAMIQYIEDNDEQYPPAIGYVHPTTATGAHDSRLVAQSWGPGQTVLQGEYVEGIISPYVKSPDLFSRPGTHEQLSYMYNDLIATQKMKDVTAPGITIMLTDAEDRPANVGHAFTPDSGPFFARFNREGRCDPGQGASIRQARFLYHDGANFTFADGHVKCFFGKPQDMVFFPPRESASSSAIDPITNRQIGPIPGDRMRFNGKAYQATFHIR